MMEIVGKGTVAVNAKTKFLPWQWKRANHRYLGNGYESFEVRVGHGFRFSVFYYWLLHSYATPCIIIFTYLCIFGGVIISCHFYYLGLNIVVIVHSKIREKFVRNINCKYLH